MIVFSDLPRLFPSTSTIAVQDKSTDDDPPTPTARSVLTMQYASRRTDWEPECFPTYTQCTDQYVKVRLGWKDQAAESINR